MQTAIFPGALLGLVLTGFLQWLLFSYQSQHDRVTLFRTGCFSCSTPYHGWRALPLFRVFITRHSCPACGSAYALDFLLVDLISPVLITAIFIQFDLLPAMELIIAYITLVASAVIDWRQWKIPNVLLFGMLAAIALRITLNVGQIAFLLTGGAVVLGVLGSVLLIQRLYMKSLGLGMGDLKLGALLGVWLGPILSVYTLFLAAGLALVYWLMLNLTSGTDFQRKIQFGPFLAYTALAIALARVMDPHLTTHLLLLGR